MSIYSQLLEELFKDRLADAKFKERSTESLDWYRKRMASYFGQSRLRLDNKPQNLAKPVTAINPGWIYSFNYRPKYKNKLPYYDAFPLVLILKLVPGGFIGLNFHYLRPIDRALFMDKLYEFEGPDTKNQTLRINIKYPALQQSIRLRYFRPCIKRYRYFNLGNFFVPLQPNEWDMALFLPTENFKKETRENVWKDSRSKY